MRNNHDIKSILKNYKFMTAAFFLPVLIMSAAFIVQGIFPFGENQIAVIDLYHQYLPLLSELQYKLHHAESLFFTWNGLGGCNFWNIIAYQAGSPLNLLLVFFPEKYIMEGITFILLIKIGLAGLCMFLYLKNIYPANGLDCSPAVKPPADIATVAFSTLYALNAYVLAYYWNVMWMDAVALLPLCMLGLRRAVDGERATLYTVSLALIVFANYYIAIMVCIFIMVYYPVLYFEKKRSGGIKAFLITTARTVCYSLLGVAMSAVLLLPTYFSMKNASVADSTFPDSIFFYKDAIEVVNQLLPSAKLSYLEGLPNVYCGMAAVILLVLYYANREKNLREVLVNTLLLVFLFFSLNVNVLDYIWHGMHYPNQLPFRYSFVVCFLLLGLAYKTFRQIDKVDTKILGAILGAGILYYLIAQKQLKDVVDDSNAFIYCGIAWLSLFVLLFLFYRKGWIRFRAMKYAFIILVIAEMSVGTITAVEKVGTTTRSAYNENVASMAALLDETRGEFARTEIDDALTINEPARLHYMGLTQFASSMSTRTSGFMKAVGLEAEPGANRSVYRPTDPVTNAILNVKYMISKYRDLDDPDFEPVTANEASGLYESKYPLSVGYMTPDSIYSYWGTSANPFENLNEYVLCATNEQCKSVFRQAGTFETAGNNATVTGDGYGNYQAQVQNTDETSNAYLTFAADTTQKYYLFVDASAAESITVEKSQRGDIEDIDEDYSGIENIGVVHEGETLSVDITFEAGGGGDFTAYLYRLDQAEWDRAYALLSADMLSITEYGDTHLKGTIDAGNGGVMMTSIPYDKGWKLYVDGRERDTSCLVGDAMISVQLGGGKHDIEMKFTPQGFQAGLIITILSVLLLIADRRLYGHRHFRRRSAAPASDEPVDDRIDVI